MNEDAMNLATAMSPVTLFPTPDWRTTEMLTKPLATFNSPTDVLGLGKDIQMEVEYECDFDGRVLIYGVNLIRYSHWDGKGQYQEKPLKTTLTLGEAWLSAETLEEFAADIEQSLREIEVEARIERAEDRRLECWY